MLNTALLPSEYLPPFDGLISSSIIIGNHAISSHNNTVVIGSRAQSTRDNQVVIQDTEICNGTLGLANNNLMIHGCNEDESKKCGLCNIPIITGVEWYRDEDTKLVMCFDCIFDSILKIKAKESWKNNAKNYDNSRSIYIPSDEIKKLQDKVSELERKIEEISKKL